MGGLLRIIVIIRNRLRTNILRWLWLRLFRVGIIWLKMKSMGCLLRIIVIIRNQLRTNILRWLWLWLFRIGIIWLKTKSMGCLLRIIVEMEIGNKMIDCSVKLIVTELEILLEHDR